MEKKKNTSRFTLPEKHLFSLKVISSMQTKSECMLFLTIEIFALKTIRAEKVLKI